MRKSISFRSVIIVVMLFSTAALAGDDRLVAWWKFDESHGKLALWLFSPAIFLFRQWKHGTKRRSFIARICVRCEYETARLPGASILKVRAIPPATPVGINGPWQNFFWKRDPIKNRFNVIVRVDYENFGAATHQVTARKLRKTTTLYSHSFA